MLHNIWSAQCLAGVVVEVEECQRRRMEWTEKKARTKQRKVLVSNVLSATVIKKDEYIAAVSILFVNTVLLL